MDYDLFDFELRGSKSLRTSFAICFWFGGCGSTTVVSIDASLRIRVKKEIGRDCNRHNFATEISGDPSNVNIL